MLIELFGCDLDRHPLNKLHPRTKCHPLPMCRENLKEKNKKNQMSFMLGQLEYLLRTLMINQPLRKVGDLEVHGSTIYYLVLH